MSRAGGDSHLRDRDHGLAHSSALCERRQRVLARRLCFLSMQHLLLTPSVRVRGTVEAVDGPWLTVKSYDGKIGPKARRAVTKVGDK
jgi:hypothetical protein